MSLICSPENPDKGLSFWFAYLRSRMTHNQSDKYLVLFFILFGVVVLFLAITALSHDPREQTVFLEVFAEQLENTQNVHPTTEQSVHALIASFQQNPPADSKLQQRQIAAINRIEAALSDQTGALRQKNTAQSSRTIRPPQVVGKSPDE